ncbi:MULTISPECIES: hypothetical protein [unclassified Microcoleus]
MGWASRPSHELNTSGFDVGFDYATGYGLIQADRPIAKIVV